MICANLKNQTGEKMNNKMEERSFSERSTWSKRRSDREKKTSHRLKIKIFRV